MHQDNIPIYQVDAFTAEAFSGNPAAVCLLERDLDDATMRAIAAEMNLSETAFVRPVGDETWEQVRDGAGSSATPTFSLRWFTPKVEVDLCGHATLATAAVLFREVGVKSDLVRFETLSGALAARRGETGIVLDFPADPPVPFERPEGLLDTLRDFTIEAAVYAPKTRNLLIQLGSADEVRALEPDFARVMALTMQGEIHGPIVTARGEPPYDFVSRYFAPWVGIEEDPVTGSAHTVLGPYWGRILGKREMFAYQASARGGELHVTLLEEARVAIAGEAVTILEGELRLP